MSYTFTNQEVARLLGQIAAAHELKNESHFKVLAYQRAATAVEHLSTGIKELWTEGRLSEVPGIGKGIAKHLDELFRTGRVKHFQQIKKRLPPGIFAILDLPGIGPKTAQKICQKYPIVSINDLKTLAKTGKLRKLEGLGEKTEQEILQAIKEMSPQQNRLLLPIADGIAREIIAELEKNPIVKKAQVLGSLRRRLSTVGDIDLAVASDDAKEVIQQFTSLKSVQKVLQAGVSKASILHSSGCRIDLMVQPPARFGSLLQHLTGSKQHNIHLRKLAIKKGLSLSEHGIKKIGDQFSEDTLFEFATEKQFYKVLGLSYIPPELREDQGEIEAAQKDKLPDLIGYDQVRGDLHLHSDFGMEPSHDLGQSSMEEMAAEAVQFGYEYIGFAEHNPAISTHTRSQVLALVKRRNSEIDKLKSSLRNCRVLKLLEVDILADGRLALDESTLQLLDFAIAGIHSVHKMKRAQMTQRILRGLQNPRVKILSHPTGRLLQKREEYEVDWEPIFKLCRDENKALEINASPRRLDLPDYLVREAVQQGVKLVINTDSHEKNSLKNIRYGIATARRGWAEKKDVINSWTYDKMAAWFGID